MVRINLLGETTDNSRAHALQLVSFGASILATIGVCVMVQMNASQRVEILRADKQALALELESLKKITKEVGDLESKKKMLQERVITIANLKAKKHGPVHTLDDLNIAMPARSWITSIKEKSGSLEIVGLALDNQTIADFMGTLDKSDYFGTVDLIQSTQTIVEGVKLKQFSLMAQLTNPKLKELPKNAPSIVPVADDTQKKGKAKGKGGAKKKFDV